MNLGTYFDFEIIFFPLPGRVFRLCMVGVVVFPENPMLSSVTEPSVNE